VEDTRGVRHHAIGLVADAIEFDPTLAGAGVALEDMQQIGVAHRQPARIGRSGRIGQARSSVLPQRRAAIRRQPRRQVDDHRHIVVRMVDVNAGLLFEPALGRADVEHAVFVGRVRIPARDLESEQPLELLLDPGLVIDRAAAHARGDLVFDVLCHLGRAIDLLEILVEVVADADEPLIRGLAHGARDTDEKTGRLRVSHLEMLCPSLDHGDLG